MVDSLVNSLNAQSLVGLSKASNVKSLFSGGELSTSAAESLLSGSYTPQANAAVQVDLSKNLSAFIEENITDPDVKASLLADIAAIAKLGGDGTNAVSSLLGAQEDDQNLSVLDLLV